MLPEGRFDYVKHCGEQNLQGGCACELSATRSSSVYLPAAGETAGRGKGSGRILACCRSPDGPRRCYCWAVLARDSRQLGSWGKPDARHKLEQREIDNENSTKRSLRSLTYWLGPVPREWSCRREFASTCERACIINVEHAAG